MKGFIENFYYGNIEPQARGIKGDSHVQKKIALLAEKETILNERLTEEEKTIFCEYVKVWDEVLSIANLDSFTVGFRLGARFAYDTFVNNDAPFVDLMSG